MSKVLEFIKMRIILGLKENKEYKANLFSIFLTDIMYLITSIFFYLILQDLIGDEILNWSAFDFMLYGFLVYLSFKFIRMLSFSSLPRFLILGKLNVILTKPITPFLFLSTQGFRGFRFVSISYLFLIILSLIFYNNYSNIFLGILVYFYGLFYLIVLYNFLYSLSFVTKSISWIFNIYTPITMMTRNYTPKLFTNFSWNLFFNLQPIAICGYYTIEVLKGNFLFFSNNYFLYSLIILFILIFFIYLLWKIGLKKYEAFG